MFSTMTDHYSLPSRDELYFTSYVPSQMMAILALPGLLFISFLVFISAPLFFYAFPLFYILFIPFVWYLFTMRKSNRLFYDTDIEAILSRAEATLGISGKVKIYHCDKKVNFIRSAHTPFLYGIMLSEKSAKLLKEKPTEGEIVLAHELALLKQDHLWLSFLRNLAVILYTIMTEGTILFPLLEPLFPIIGQIPLWIFAVSLSYPLGIGIFVWYRRKASAENEVESIYGMNPQLASFQVFSRKNMSDEGRSHYISQIESDIESRHSRTAFISLGIVSISSLAISAAIYVIFMAFSMTFEFALFGASALGGIYFLFGVYHFESRGAGRLRHPKISIQEVPQSTDELTTSVEKLLSEKVSISGCKIIHYPYDFESDYDDEGFDFIEAQIAQKRIVITKQEWDELKDPELISSYLAGEYVGEKAGIGSYLVSAVLIGFLILLISGTAYLVVAHMPQLTFFLWIGFCLIYAFTSLLSINFETTRSRTKALRALAERDVNYLQALRKLVDNQTEHEYFIKEAKQTLKRITSKTN